MSSGGSARPSARSRGQGLPEESSGRASGGGRCMIVVVKFFFFLLRLSTLSSRKRTTPTKKNDDDWRERERHLPRFTQRGDQQPSCLRLSAWPYLRRDAQGAVGQSESHGEEQEGRAGRGTRGEGERVRSRFCEEKGELFEERKKFVDHSPGSSTTKRREIERGIRFFLPVLSFCLSSFSSELERESELGALSRASMSEQAAAADREERTSGAASADGAKQLLLPPLPPPLSSDLPPVPRYTPFLPFLFLLSPLPSPPLAKEREQKRDNELTEKGKEREKKQQRKKPQQPAPLLARRL